MTGFLAQISGLFRNSRGDGRRSGRKLRKIQSLETRRLLAADFQLVKDINLTLLMDSSQPSDFVSVNSTLFFVTTRFNEYALWKTDGTVAGTTQVKVVHDPENLTNVGGMLFFTAKDWSDDGDAIGRELWKSDGTEAGTVMVKDIRPGTGEDDGSSPSDLVNVDGLLYFAADDGEHGRELWKSDGTPQGTVMVKDVFTGTYVEPPSHIWDDFKNIPNNSSPAELTNVNGVLYFAATDGLSGRELWKSDGTAAGTVLVRDVFVGTHKGEELLFNGEMGPKDIPNDSLPRYLTAMDGTLFFRAHDGVAGHELWKSDGTAGGTTLVRNIRSGPLSSSPGRLTVVGKSLYFTANDGTSGTELWKSNGTSDGTVIVKDIRAGSGGSSPSNLTNVSGILYFTTTEPETKLYSSDGTSSGTSVVGTYQDVPIWWPRYLVNAGGTLYFSATAGVGSSGIELWKSDGTQLGTRLVKDIDPGEGSSRPRHLADFNGTLFFSARDGEHGYEMWKSDGTAAGTQLINVDPENTFDSSPDFFAHVGGHLYFSANDSINGVELWKSDGTPAGTSMVRNIRVAGGADPRNLTAVGRTLFFTANDGTHGVELWKSDGTVTGTVMVKDILPGEEAANPGNFTDVGGTLYFTAHNGSHGVELWKSDGTPAGTVMVRDIRPASGSAAPANLTNVNGALYFSASSGANRRELWKTDGTLAGTVRVKNDFNGNQSPNPSHMINLAGTLYFTANDDELWKSNGTAAGTVMVKETPNSLVRIKAIGAGGLLYFLTETSDSQELWKSDGTSAGTVLVKGEIGDSTYIDYVGEFVHSSDELISAGGILYFTAYTRDHGIELWKSDGTSNGTMMLRDLNTGKGTSRRAQGGEFRYPLGSSPGSFTKVGSDLYFVATGSSGGNQIWKTNGTAAGTVQVSENRFPLNGYVSGPIHFAGNKLYAAMTTEPFGEELFVADLAKGTTGNDVFTLRYAGQSPKSEVTVTLSTNGGPTTTLGTFATDAPLSLNGLSGNDSVRIVGTPRNEVFKVSATELWFTHHRIILNSIENRTLSGGAGDDEYRFDTDSPLGLFTLDEALGGRDTLSFDETSTRAVDVKLGVSTTQVINAHLSLILGSSVAFENVNGGAANDTLVGNAVGNVLRGNGGHDLINGTQGSDTLIGGLGNDTFSFGASTPGEADTVVELPSQGTDTLSFESLTVDVQLNLSQTTAQQVHANRKLTLNSGSTFENVLGGTKNDTLTGNSLSNVLRGNAGHDVLNGASGSDSLVGGIGNDLYTFGASTPGETDVVTELQSQGLDTLSFTSLLIGVNLNLSLTTSQLVHTNRRVRLSSGAAIENAYGGAGNDSITGNALGNQLRGNAGNDSLNGTVGNDILVGGTGDDTYSFGASAPGEEDVVTELSSQGTDTLSFAAVTSDLQANLNLSTAQTVHANRKLTLNSGATFENVIGGSGNDIIIGNSLNNTLVGNGGRDILVGNSGNDRLLGGSGRDLLIGGLGRDSLDGGADDDILVAGRTTHDGLTANLNVIRQEWSSSLSYASRVSRLRSGVGSPAVSLKARTNVLNDAGDDDSLTGGLGSDWFLRALDDAILDLATSELIDLL